MTPLPQPLKSVALLSHDLNRHFTLNKSFMIIAVILNYHDGIKYHVS